MTAQKTPRASSSARPDAALELVSLAEASRRTGRMLKRSAKTSAPETGSPSLNDLTESLLFSPGDGRIWLDKQRMVLLHSSTLGALRRELLNGLGHDAGRAALARVGFAQGSLDAQLVKERWSDAEALSQWQAGPSLHTLEGFVRVTTLSHEFDMDCGRFRGEYRWDDSVEADEHIALYGLSKEPVCWMLTAYASGFASAMFGYPVVFRETQCRGAGDSCCHVVARPAHEWEAVEPDIATFVPTRSDGVRASNAAGDGDGIATRERVIGLSAPFIAARQQLEQVAPTNATVLLRGESGAGKELFAKTLHRLSRRCDAPFVAINCAAIPDSLIESELFGVERGAFTGATHTRPGRFERADGGTLFLDEVASMSASAQGKLLRALQEHEIERVGATKSLPVDVRVVAATNVDLWLEVEAQRFRRDLFFRLNVFPIDLPSLRERRDDIPFLVDHFLRHYSALHEKKLQGISRRAMQALLDYDYPGNVRELQNLIERGTICASDGALVDTTHIFRHGEKSLHASFTLGRQGRLRAAEPVNGKDSKLGQASPTGMPSVAGPSLEEIERRICEQAMQSNDANLSAAARQLGLTRATLEYRLRKWGMLPRQRNAGP